MVYVDERMLEPVRERYGAPRMLRLQVEVSRPELDLVVASGGSGRRHDVTFFVMNGERLALIRKPHFPPGVWRPPSGGIHRGEVFEAGVRREAAEEIGAAIELDRYLVVADGLFTCGDDSVEWRTHVFSATTEARELVPNDTVEIAAARWGTLPELAGPIRERLLELVAAGRGLWRYRVGLHDAALAELGLPAAQP